MGLTLIDGGGETTEVDPWDQANLELIPDPSVIPPGMRLVRGDNDWAVKTRSGKEVLHDYSAMAAVSRAWSVYASMTTEFDTTRSLPSAVEVSELSSDAFCVEFTGYGHIVASPEFHGRSHAMAYVQQLLADIESEDEYRGHTDGGTISLPEGIQLCTMDNIDYEHYGFRSAGFVFSVFVDAREFGEEEEEETILRVQEIAQTIYDNVVTDTVAVKRTSYGPYVVEYGVGDTAHALYADFSSYHEALRAVQDVRRAIAR